MDTDSSLQERHVTDLEVRPVNLTALVLKPPKWPKPLQSKPQKRYTMLFDLDCSPEDLPGIFGAVNGALINGLSALASDKSIAFTISALRVPKEPIDV